MGEVYIVQVKSADKALKDATARMKKLREQREQANARLYAWMVRNHLEEYEGIKISKVKPKQKRPRKKLAQKRQETIMVLTTMGVENPEHAWEKIQEVVKNKNIASAASEGV